MLEEMESKQEKIRYCLEKSPELLKPYIPEAFNLIIEVLEEPFNYISVTRIIKTAGFLSTRNIKTDEKSNEFFELKPDNILSAEESFKNIKPELIKLREELFGENKTPFNWDEAITWIQHENEKAIIAIRKQHNENKDKIVDIRDKIFKLKNKFNELSTKICSVEFETLTFPSPSKTGWKEEFIIQKNSLPGRLAIGTKRISDITNFNQLSLIMFVLAEMSPLPIAYTILKSMGRKTSVEIKINRVLTYKELTTLFHDINEFLKPKGKQFNKKHLKIYVFIEDTGGVPSERKMDFWRNQWDEWNKLNQKEKFKTSDGLRIAYDKIKRQLSKREGMDEEKIEMILGHK